MAAKPRLEAGIETRAGIGRGAVETLVVLAGFVGFGLGWAELARSGPARSGPDGDPVLERPFPGPYPARMAAEIEPDVDRAPRIWLVDGFNVLHTALLSGRDRSDWWSSARRAEVLELAAALGRAGEETAQEVWVVFDGPREQDGTASEPGPVREVFARSADEWLVARVKSSPDPARIAVVTADRKVADRSRHRGAQVVSPQQFLAACREGALPPS